MLVFTLAVIAVICGFGWFSMYLGNAGLLWYLSKRNVPFPTDEELKEGCRWALSHIIEDLRGGGSGV